jgi:16S rRNA (guanine1516-N2)-methyltransferase
MFPPSDKSALVKKEMRLFQQLFHRAESNGAIEDYSTLLATARSRARVRVVVKRPRKAPALADQAPDYSLEGKAVRFDIYIGASA